jgi:hypothetical protein
LVRNQDKTINRLETEHQQALNERAGEEAQLDEQRRQLREANEAMKTVLKLSDLELTNLRNNNEKIIVEKELEAKRLQEEVNAAMDATRRIKEQINKVQNQRLKEVSSLKN